MGVGQVLHHRNGCSGVVRRARDREGFETLRIGGFNLGGDPAIWRQPFHLVALYAGLDPLGPALRLLIEEMSVESRQSASAVYL